MPERTQFGNDRERLFSRLTALSAAKGPQAPDPALRPPATRNQRQEPRQPTYRFARIFVGRQPIRNCIVRDISASGARIAMEGACDLPETIVLVIGQAGRRIRARVAWRSEHEAGLCFLGEIRSAAAGADDRVESRPSS